MSERDSTAKKIVQLSYTTVGEDFGVIDGILIPPGYTVREPIGFSIFRKEGDFGVRIAVVNAHGIGKSLDEALEGAGTVLIEQAEYLRSKLKGRLSPEVQTMARWHQRKIEVKQT